jgi:hypothetical protein
MDVTMHMTTPDVHARSAASKRIKTANLAYEAPHRVCSIRSDTTQQHPWPRTSKHVPVVVSAHEPLLISSLGYRANSPRCFMVRIKGTSYPLLMHVAWLHGMDLRLNHLSTSSVFHLQPLEQTHRRPMMRRARAHMQSQVWHHFTAPEASGIPNLVSSKAFIARCCVPTV